MRDGSLVNFMRLLLCWCCRSIVSAWGACCAVSRVFIVFSRGKYSGKEEFVNDSELFVCSRWITRGWWGYILYIDGDKSSEFFLTMYPSDIQAVDMDTESSVSIFHTGTHLNRTLFRSDIFRCFLNQMYSGIRVPIYSDTIVYSETLPKYWCGLRNVQIEYLGQDLLVPGRLSPAQSQSP